VKDLVQARFLWRRLSPHARGDVDVVAAWALGRFLWRKERKAFFEMASSHSWTPPCEGLAARLVQRERADVLALLSRAYSAVSLAAAEGMLGLDRDETLRTCLGAGWTQDGEFLVPDPSGAVADTRGSRGGSARPTVEQSLQALTNLTEQLVRLQTA
jgi:CSN8/PSMD8/EIF3K family